jgi:hypothetical protein
MTLDASGELRIGAANEGCKQTLSGAAGFAGNGLSIYENSTGNNARLRVSQNSGEVVYNATYGSGANAQVWQIGNGEVARLNSAGVFVTANGMVTTTGQLMTGTVTTNGSGNAQIGVSGWSLGEYASYRRNIFVMLGIQGGTYLGTWVGVVQWAVSSSVLGTTSTNSSGGAGTITFATDGNTGGRWFQLTGVPANSTFSYVIRGFAVTEDYRSNYGAF